MNEISSALLILLAGGTLSYFGYRVDSYISGNLGVDKSKSSQETPQYTVLKKMLQEEIVQRESKSETYDMEITCANCNVMDEITMTKGKPLTGDLLLQMECEHCGCKGYMEKRSKSPVDVKGKNLMVGTGASAGGASLGARGGPGEGCEPGGGC